MNPKKYGVTSLRKQFPTDESIVEFIFDANHSRECSCGGSFSLMKNGTQKSRTFQCSKCRAKISPTAGTIFHKSDTPLTLWFEAILRFSNAKSGYSAKQLQRDLEVTYKCAWRMFTLIRKALPQDMDTPLSGDVEMDSAYFGGKGHGGEYNKHQKKVMADKSVAFAAVQRGGSMRAEVRKDMTARTHKNFLWANVSTKNTRLMTDKTNKLDNVAKGYERHAVDHSRKEYVRGAVHVNNVERFWGHVKRSIKGTHKVVSKAYLQSYLDGFVWHYNQRTGTDAERFAALLGAVLRPVV